MYTGACAEFIEILLWCDSNLATSYDRVHFQIFVQDISRTFVKQAHVPRGQWYLRTENRLCSCICCIYVRCNWPSLSQNMRILVCGMCVYVSEICAWQYKYSDIAARCKTTPNFFAELFFDYWYIYTSENHRVIIDLDHGMVCRGQAVRYEISAYSSWRRHCWWIFKERLYAFVCCHAKYGSCMV